MGTNFHTALVTGTSKWRAADVNVPPSDLDKAITYLRPVLAGCDGIVTFDPASGKLYWSDNIHIYFNSEAGAVIHNYIAAGTVTIPNNYLAYVTLSEINNTALSISIAAIPDGSASNFLAYNIVVLGYRNSGDGGFYPLCLSGIPLFKNDDAILRRDNNQAVDLLYTTYGTGISIPDNNNLDYGILEFSGIVDCALPDYIATSEIVLEQKTDGTNGRKFSLQNTGNLRQTINATDFDATVPTGLINGTRHVFGYSVFRETAENSGYVLFTIDGRQLGEPVVITAGSPTTVNNASTQYILGTSVKTEGARFYGFMSANYAMTEQDHLDIYRNGIPALLQWGNQTELMPDQVDRDFSGASAWENVDISSYNETGDLTITADAIDQYCKLPALSAPMTYGKKYGLSFSVANIVGSWIIKDYTGDLTIGAVAANGAQLLKFDNDLESCTGGFRIVSETADASGDFDNFSLIGIGVTASIGYEGIRNLTGKLLDNSANELHATLPAGAELAKHILDNLDGREQAIVCADTITIDWSLGATAFMTFDRDAVTITFSNGDPGKVYRLMVTQSAGGADTITWNTTIQWRGGVEPILTATNSAVDILTFVYIDNQWYGDISKNFG